ncbi:MAG: 30S ribosomal protein S1 [Desulfobacterales bacterium]|nr:30S ribosomal protein S1 [Desulfobacterales bacterium]
MVKPFDDDNTKENEKSFAAMLDAYSCGMDAEIRVGDKIRGKIVSIGANSVFVDTGTKIDGIADRKELLDENQQMTLKEGDLLELYVVALADDEIRLSKAVSGIGGLHMLREAFEKAVPVEGKIFETCKGGFRVEVLERNAFCPISQVDIIFVENPSDYVGKSLNFLITTFEENGKNIVLNRRALLAREQEKIRKVFYETLSVGDVLDGMVTKIMPYGVFVQLSEGVEGLVHISELGWSKAARPETIAKVADRLQVKVIGIEPDKKPGLLKISLSTKQLTEDPWIRAGDHFQVGAKIPGTVTRCANFGAFVEVAAGIEGLVHISEMSYQKRILKPDDVVTVGETISVMIKEIDLEKKRMSLSIRDAEGDPWITVAEKYTVGQTLEGLLEKKEKFGFFITLEPGITGLIPKSKIGGSAKPAEIAKLKEGDPLPVVIEAINPAERKITLIPGNTADEQNWQTFASDASSSMGSLGEKLQHALDKKK